MCFSNSGFRNHKHSQSTSIFHSQRLLCHRIRWQSFLAFRQPLILFSTNTVLHALYFLNFSLKTPTVFTPLKTLLLFPSFKTVSLCFVSVLISFSYQQKTQFEGSQQKRCSKQTLLRTNILRCITNFHSQALSIPPSSNSQF